MTDQRNYLSSLHKQAPFILGAVAAATVGGGAASGLETLTSAAGLELARNLKFGLLAGGGVLMLCGVSALAIRRAMTAAYQGAVEKLEEVAGVAPPSGDRVELVERMTRVGAAMDARLEAAAEAEAARAAEARRAAARYADVLRQNEDERRMLLSAALGRTVERPSVSEPVAVVAVPPPSAPTPAPVASAVPTPAAQAAETPLLGALNAVEGGLAEREVEDLRALLGRLDRTQKSNLVSPPNGFARRMAAA